MQHVRYQKGNNTPGLECFFFIETQQLLRELRPGLDVVAQSLITEQLPLTPSAQWFQAIVGKHTLQYRGGSRIRRAGREYDHTLSGVIPRISPEMSAAIRQFDQRKFVIIYQDRNNFLRMIGAKNYGLTFSYEEDTGRVPGDRNQLSFSFTGKSKFPAYFYHGNLYESLSGAELLDFGDVTIQARVLTDGITIRTISQ